MTVGANRIRIQTEGNFGRINEYSFDRNRNEMRCFVRTLSLQCYSSALLDLGSGRKMNDSRRDIYFFFSLFLFILSSAVILQAYIPSTNKAVKLTYLCSHDVEFWASRWLQTLLPLLQCHLMLLLAAGHGSVVRQPSPSGPGVTFTLQYQSAAGSQEPASSTV